jgi:hypothetical protein
MPSAQSWIDRWELSAVPGGWRQIRALPRDPGTVPPHLVEA